MGLSTWRGKSTCRCVLGPGRNDSVQAPVTESQRKAMKRDSHQGEQSERAAHVSSCQKWRLLLDRKGTSAASRSLLTGDPSALERR